MSTILVTGATGRAGRYVIPVLQNLGFHVRGQYNRERGPAEHVDWRQMNFLECRNFRPLVAGCEAVIHLAAELRDVTRMHHVNVEATRVLLAAAQSEGARYFGYASSIVVYGSPRRRVVDESTPLIDPQAPIIEQYHAEPYMLEYARTKTLAELTIRAFKPNINVDFYRPAVVADRDRLLEAGGWSFLRKLATAYRRTQYIYAGDAAAAIAHLAARGLTRKREQPLIEPFNICDEDCGTFRDILRAAYGETKDPRYRLRAELPFLLDIAKDVVRYRDPWTRYPLGMLKFVNAKLIGSGFKFPTGIRAALDQAIAQQLPQTADDRFRPKTLPKGFT